MEWFFTDFIGNTAPTLEDKVSRALDILLHLYRNQPGLANERKALDENTLNAIAITLHDEICLVNQSENALISKVKARLETPLKEPGFLSNRQEYRIIKQAVSLGNQLMARKSGEYIDADRKAIIFDLVERAKGAPVAFGQLEVRLQPNKPHFAILAERASSEKETSR